jgi:hypothetical protein
MHRPGVKATPARTIPIRPADESDEVGLYEIRRKI